jgi:RNA polymerase sigma-70 factor (sigma-E family)
MDRSWEPPVEVAVGDDETLFRSFFGRHYRQLRDLAFLLCGDWGEAEELAQEALVRTFAAWRTIRDHDHAGAFARRVLINRHRSVLRRALTQAKYAHWLPKADQTTSEPTTDDRLLLWPALLRLPARQRTALVLRYYEDLSEQEIARLAGWPLGTVKSLIRRGLERLRAEPGLLTARLAESRS